MTASSSLLNLSENKLPLHANHKCLPFQSAAKDTKYPSEIFPYRVVANSRSERQLTSFTASKYNNELLESDQLFVQNNNRSHNYSATGLTNKTFNFVPPPIHFQKAVCTSHDKQDIQHKYQDESNHSDKDQRASTSYPLKKSKSARKEISKNDHTVCDKLDLVYPFDLDSHVAITQWIRTGYSTRANDFNYVSALMSDTTITPILKENVEFTASTAAVNNVVVKSESKKPIITETFPDLISTKSETKHKNSKILKKNVEVQEILEPKKRLYSAVLSNSNQPNEFVSPLCDKPASDVPLSPNIVPSADAKNPILCPQAIPDDIEKEFPQVVPDVSKKTASTGSMEKCYEELERQAIEQYKESDESLDSKYYQELERQAVEQYSASSQSNIDNQALAASSMDSSQLSTDTSTLYLTSTVETPLKVDVVNYIKLGKTTPKQKKKGKKRKSKRSNLKNPNSPHQGADLKSHVVINKGLNSTESNTGKILDYFIIQYTYKSRTMNLKLLIRDEELAKHMKNIVHELKSGIICKQCRIFPLMSSVEELYSGKGIHYFPIEECTFSDLNHLPQADDDSCVMTTKVFFEGKEIEVYREMSSILFCNTNLRLMVPSRTDLENFKKSLPKTAIEKKIIKHTANSYDSATRHFLQMGVRAIHNCNVFCHFIYYSCRHELNDYSNIKLMGFERVRRLLDHVRSVWRFTRGYLASGIFFEGYPQNMAIKLWSPFRYILRVKRFSKEPERDKYSDSMIRYRANGKSYNHVSKSGSFRSFHTFIDQAEIKHIIESEYIYTMLNLQKHFSGMVYYKYYAKPDDAEESTKSIKFDCEFIRNITGILRNMNSNPVKRLNSHVGLFGKSELNSSVSSIYHVTADILERHWLFTWGFLAVDLNICDPWNYNNNDCLNEKYPIYYPKFIVKKPQTEPIPIKPIYQNPHICSCKHPYITEPLHLPNGKSKKRYLQLSEQQKGDLKSLIALTLNKEIKSKDDVQKISVTMSKLIKNEIIEKLEQMSINKKLNTEKTMIVKSAEKIHRKIINSTFTEIVLELCRGRKVKDTDLERKEQIFAAMIENLKQLYHLRTEVHQRNVMQLTSKTHNNEHRRNNNPSIHEKMLNEQSNDEIKKTVDTGMQTTNSLNSNYNKQHKCMETDANEEANIKMHSNYVPKKNDGRNRRQGSSIKTKSKPLTETVSNDIIHKITRYSPRPNRKNISPSIIESISQTSNTPQLILGEEEEENSGDTLDYSDAADKKPDSSCGVM